MANKLDELTAGALKLPPAQRAELVQRLMASVEPVAPLHPAWEAEIAKRIADLETRTAKATPCEQVFAELRSARLGAVLDRIRNHAEVNGLDKITDEEIQEEISAVRKQRRANSP